MLLTPRRQAAASTARPGMTANVCAEPPVRSRPPRRRPRSLGRSLSAPASLPPLFDPGGRRTAEAAYKRQESVGRTKAFHPSPPHLLPLPSRFPYILAPARSPQCPAPSTLTPCPSSSRKATSLAPSVSSVSRRSPHFARHAPVLCLTALGPAFPPSSQGSRAGLRSGRLCLVHQAQAGSRQEARADLQEARPR